MPRKVQWDLILQENKGRSCEVEKPLFIPFQGEYSSPTFRDSSQSHYLRGKVNLNPSVLSRTPQTANHHISTDFTTTDGQRVGAINEINPEGSNRSVPDRQRELYKHYLEYKGGDKRSASSHSKPSAALMCEWCESVTVRLCDADRGIRVSVMSLRSADQHR